MKRPDKTALWLALALYLSACVLPATKSWMSTDMGRGGNEHYETVNGALCLTLGWIEVAAGVAGAETQPSFGMFSWVANPLAFLSVLLLLCRRNTGAGVFSAAGLVLGVLYLVDPPIHSGHKDLPQIGAWLWVGSLLSLVTAAYIRRRSQPRVEPAPLLV